MPISPNNIYIAWLSGPHFLPKNNPAMQAKKVCKVISSIGRGILINPPAQVNAQINAVAAILKLIDLYALLDTWLVWDINNQILILVYAHMIAQYILDCKLNKHIWFTIAAYNCRKKFMQINIFNISTYYDIII